MAYASKSGRARTSSTNPEAFAVCQRCGIWYNAVALSFQFDWRGAALQNTYLKVCRHCYDLPQEQLRAIVVPADPVPIKWPLIESFFADESDPRMVSLAPVTDPITGIPIPSSTQRITQTGGLRVTQPIGPPVGLEQAAVMPLYETTHYAVDVQPLSVISDGVSIVTVTCRVPHGLVTNDQVSVEGLTVAEATGFYSVTVTTATAFTYMTNRPVAAGSLLTSTTLIITALVGLPYNSTQIPQTGI